MALVDASVWIDFFAARPTPEASELERLLNEGRLVFTCGVVLTEVLQGFRKDEDYRRTLTRFGEAVYLPMRRRTFLAAADIYRSLRGRGITIRKSVDCMIAAVAIEYDLPLLHNDRDFDPIEAHCGLKVVKVTKHKP
jgi:predicted nucleic acid-binding protein